MGLLSVLRGGIPVVFLAGKREIAELLSFHQKDFIIQPGNRIVKKVRLYVSFAEKFSERQTGFWFDPVLDFDPPLPDKRSDGVIPWEDLGSTVICCFRSFDGLHHWRDGKIESLQRRITTLNDSLLSVKRDSLTLIRVIEKYKDPEVRKEEAFESAEMLAAIQRIVNRAPETDEDEIFKKLKERSGEGFFKV